MNVFKMVILVGFFPLILLARGTTSSTATIKGKIYLPSTITPKNLYSSALLWESSSEDSCNANKPLSYPAMPTSDLKIDKAFRLFLWSLDSATSTGVVPISLASDGSYSASVSTSSTGYCVSAVGDRIHLVNCLVQSISGGKTYTADLNLDTTVKALALASSGKLTTPGATVDATKLSNTVSQLNTLIQNPVSSRVLTLAGAEASGQSTALSSEISQTSALRTSSDEEVKKYTEADRVPYALAYPSQIVSPVNFNFTVSRDLNLLTSQSYSAQGVRFGISAGSKATVTNVLAGHVRVSLLKPNELLEIRFTNNNVRSFGFRLANGSDPGKSSIRRAFRVRAYDQMGLPVGIPLNWYTNQTGTPSFYGLTVNSANSAIAGDECLKPDGTTAYCERPIYRVLINLSESVVATQTEYNTLQSQGDPFYLDDLVISTSYSPLPNLGWVSNGWELTNAFPGQNPAGNFKHTDRDNPTSPDPEAMCTYVNNWSGKNHWIARYPTTTPSGWVKKTLMGPAFTLTNFPLDFEDNQSGNKWAKGPLSIPFNPLWNKFVRFAGQNSCYDEYVSDMNPNDPSSWNDPNAPVEWTYLVSRCRAGDPIACTVSPWRTWLPQGIWTDHWSHVHAQIYYASEQSKDGLINSAAMGEAPNTRIYQEYSTDNGSTWKLVYWHGDEDHRGRNGIWWHSHNHPFADSDAGAFEVNYKRPFNGTGGIAPKRNCQNTDFYKSGWRKTQTAYKKGVYNYDFLTKQSDGTFTEGADGLGPNDTNDTSWDGECREWDTEFYQEVNVTKPLDNLDNCCRSFSAIAPEEQSACMVTDAFGCFAKSNGTRCACDDESVILGTTLRYRFVFETKAAASSLTCYKLDGSAIPCEGVRIDDVAFNNDTPDGYYTDFEYFENQNLGGIQ